MNILTILGSPRLRGNTATILGWFEQQAAAQGHNLTRINLADYELEGCQGCMACQTYDDEPGCIQEDAISDILQSILAADLIVYTSPVYCWGFTAQMKAVIDRHFCLVKWHNGKGHRLFPGKQAMLLTTCGDSAPENADLIQMSFERQIEYLDWHMAGMYVVDNCSEPDQLGELARSAVQDMLSAVASLAKTA